LLILTSYFALVLGSNNVCAEWCHLVFDEPYASDCTSKAANKQTRPTSLCYNCGPMVPENHPVRELCGRTCCDVGKVCCDDVCVDHQTDINHCGSCDNVCLPGESCCGGSCISCTTLGKNCGSVSDGCGATLDCGSCIVPHETCGGSNTPNVCGCIPAFADSVCPGLECGFVSDGCGGQVPCGECEVGTCGTDNICESPPCTPLTYSTGGCEQPVPIFGFLQQVCDRSIPDGCGGTLNCVTCGQNTFCGETNFGITCICDFSGCSGCTPHTVETACTQFNLCGIVSDGCSGSIDCGNCNDPNQTCSQGICGP